MIAKLGQIEVPDCLSPEVYHVEPMIIAGSVFGGVILVIAITILVAMWIDNR